jgi:fused signal recognition particle receptor
MFDLLKKKIGGFIDNIVKKTEPKAEKIEVVKEAPKPENKEAVEQIEIPEQTIEEKPVEPAKIEKPVFIEEKPKRIEKKERIIEHKKDEKNIERKKEEKKVEHKKEEKRIEHRKEEQIIEPPKVEKIKKEEKIEPPKPEPKKEHKPEKKEEPKLKVGIVKHVQSIFTGEVEISEQEVSELLENLELELLESDVAIEVADEIKEDLRKAMAGTKIKRSEVGDFAKKTIRNTLIRIVKSDKAFDLLERVKDHDKPVKILFLGVNGSGKTTTIAKIANMLLKKGHTLTLASADTFRSAAIEQMQIHADRLGVRNIKREYGSDPTAVAYDAVNYAKAHEIEFVLIDTAGRQETDLNLINELKKINRVIQPDLKIYIGESIAGNAILSQVEEFNKAVGIDGVILTKLDCDAKGGTFLSITKSTGIPIIYVGTGQRYEDIEKFDAEEIIDRILG